MENYYDSNSYGNYDSFAVSSASLIRTVYLWMTGALAITGLTAWYVAHNAAAMSFIFGHVGVMSGLIIAELALVIPDLRERNVDKIRPLITGKNDVKKLRIKRSGGIRLGKSIHRCGRCGRTGKRQ